MEEVELLLVRHAHAEARRAGYTDAARRLTDRGRSQAKAGARALRVLRLRPDAVRHSPWARAVETASLLEPACRSEFARAVPWLARAPDRHLLSALVSMQSGLGTPARARAEARVRLVLVGHQPWLSQLAAWLLTGDRRHCGKLRLGKGGLLWLQGVIEPGGMLLRGAFTPKSLRRIGSGKRSGSRGTARRVRR